MKENRYETAIAELTIMKQEILAEIAAIDRLIIRFRDKLSEADIIPMPKQLHRYARHGWVQLAIEALRQTGREMTAREIADYLEKNSIVDQIGLEQILSSRLASYLRHHGDQHLYRMSIGKQRYAYGLLEWKNKGNLAG